MTWPCLRTEGKGLTQRVLIDLSISPNAKRTEAVGWHDGALRLRVAAPPVDGAANEAIRGWLSKALDVPQARVTLLRGATSRRKQWAIDADAGRIQTWLKDLVASGQIPPVTS